MLRVLFVSGREPTYVRVALLLRALRANFQVTEITSSAKSMIQRLLEVSMRLLIIRPEYDVAVAGFFGQPIVPLLGRLNSNPIIFDAFISAYDTLCFDREIASPKSSIGKLAFWLDKSACSLSSQIITDTRAHAQYFAQTFDVPHQKISPLYLGYDKNLFFPRPKPEAGPFLVFYYGTFLPLHGVEYIVKAAKLVQKETDIRFLIVGRGKAYPSVRRLAHSISVNNIDFVDWIPYEKLPETIATASICLGGHFSNIEKAKRVISGKTYQFLAMERPTIVGDSLAANELFQHKENVFMCPQADEYALASAILELKRDIELRNRIARSGRELVASLFDNKTVESNVRNIVESTVRQNVELGSYRRY